MNVKALHSFVQVFNVLGRLSELSFLVETWKGWTFVSSNFNSPALQQCLSVESFCLRTPWVRLKLTAVSSSSLRVRISLQSYDSSWLSAFISSPSVSFSLLLLLLEVWHSACWPEGNSHPWNPCKRDFWENPNVLVCCWAVPLLGLMFFCCDSFCFLISPSN